MMFSRRKVRPRLVRFLYRQLDDESLPQETRDAIAQAVSDYDLTDELNKAVANRANAVGAPPLEGLFNNASDHPFLDWLKDNLPWIIQLIASLLGIHIPPLPTP
jgi:hypothetical protein